MRKYLRNYLICILVILVVVLAIDLFLIYRFNNLENYIKNIDVVVDCPHINNDTTTTFHYIESDEDDNTIGKNTTEIEDEEDINNTTIEPVEELSVNSLKLSDEDFTAICKVVEAETHGADIDSKMHVVHVILNRINSPDFPDSIQNVCNQSGQFASRNDVEQSTIDAVNSALTTTDTTNGALFFCTCKGCWADKNKEYIFIDNIGHRFYK